MNKNNKHQLQKSGSKQNDLHIRTGSNRTILSYVCY